MSTNLANTIFQVIKYAKINKSNDKNNANVTFLAANIHQALKST